MERKRRSATGGMCGACTGWKAGNGVGKEAFGVGLTGLDGCAWGVPGSTWGIVKRERVIGLVFGVVVGILIGNIGWIMPTAISWGGGWNILGCVFFSAAAIALLWIGACAGTE